MKQYVAAVHRDFDVLTGALQLMMRDGLNVMNPVVATQCALQLQKMNAKFNGAIVALALRGGWRMKGGFAPEPPPHDMLVRLLQVSFFKVFEPSKATKKLKDLGLYSGHPFDWEGMPKQTEVDSWAPGDKLGSLLNAFSQLFDKPVPSSFKTAQPPPQSDERDDDYEDDEDEENWADDWFLD